MLPLPLPQSVDSLPGEFSALPIVKSFWKDFSL